MLTIKDIAPHKEPLRSSLDTLECGTLFIHENRPNTIFLKIKDIQVIDWNGTIYNAIDLKTASAVSFTSKATVIPIHDSHLVLNSGGLYHA